MRKALMVLTFLTACGACDDGGDDIRPRIMRDGDTTAMVTPGDRIAPSWNPPVEKVDGAIVQAGMRSCFVLPEQQPGEVAIMRYIDESSPPYPYNNYPSRCMSLVTNGRWPNLHVPNASWYSGEDMGDYIRKASFYVPPGSCVGFKPYEIATYLTPYTFLGNWVCRAPWQSGENWLLWNQNWAISSMKTAYIPCGSTYCNPPADF